MISEQILSAGERSFLMRRQIKEGQLTDEQLQQIKRNLNCDVILKGPNGDLFICDEILSVEYEMLPAKTDTTSNIKYEIKNATIGTIIDETA